MPLPAPGHSANLGHSSTLRDSLPLWSLLALGAAICTTGADLLLRALLRHGLTARLAMGGSCLLTTLLALPALMLGQPAVALPSLLLALLATALLNGVAFWSYGRALARGELSLVLPLINLSPVVLLLSGWLVLGERPRPGVAAGVALLVCGAVLLGRSDLLRRGLLRAPGAREMLLTAVLWGIGASIDKIGVRAGGSLLWVAGLNLVVGTPLLLASLMGGDPHRLLPSPDGPARELFDGRSGRRRLLQLLAVAALSLVGTTMQMEALRFTAVVHVVAIKRLSSLMGSVIGVLWLREYSGSLRLPAAALMSGGAVLVLLAARS